MSADRSHQPHTCHAIGCSVPVPPAMLCCRHHWFMVPVELRKAVWRTYRRGQEIDKRPSNEYLLAARTAIYAIAVLERRVTQEAADGILKQLKENLGV